MNICFVLFIITIIRNRGGAILREWRAELKQVATLCGSNSTYISTMDALLTHIYSTAVSHKHLQRLLHLSIFFFLLNLLNFQNGRSTFQTLVPMQIATPLWVDLPTRPSLLHCHPEQALLPTNVWSSHLVQCFCRTWDGTRMLSRGNSRSPLALPPNVRGNTVIVQLINSELWVWVTVFE